MDASQTEELDRAADGQLEVQSVEETVEQAPEQTPEQKQRDEENAERSKLGRKVKTLEDQISRLATLLEQKAEPQYENEDPVITPENLPRHMQKLREHEATQKKAYEKLYTSEFVKIGTEDIEFDSVWQEMVKNHNEIVTGDPSVDAKINYLAAENALLKKGPKNPAQGKGSTTNTKVNVPGNMKEKNQTVPTLDPAAEEFVRRMGIKPERVAEILRK